MLLKKNEIKSVVKFADVVHGDVAALTLLVELAHGVFRGDVAIPTGLLTHSDLRIPESCEADD